MQIAILSTFPPVKCGIGQYAEQQALCLEGQGHRVERLNIAAELAERGWAIGLNRKFLQLIRRVKASDKAYLHYQVSLYQDWSCKDARLKYLLPHLLLSYLCLRFREKLEVIVHEYSYKLYPHISDSFQWWASALFFRIAPRLYFHTRHERSAFAQVFFEKEGAKLLSPNSFYLRRSRLNRKQARAILSVPEAYRVFLCIGFFHPGKGFAQFAEVFQKLHDRKALLPEDHLYIVTSVRLDADVHNRALLASLVTQVQKCPFIHAVNRYLDDAEFDHWIVASDFVVVPYLWGFTSSIAARASLYAKPCIISAVGGLAEQVSERDYAYTSRAELESILTSTLPTGRPSCT